VEFFNFPPDFRPLGYTGKRPKTRYDIDTSSRKENTPKHDRTRRRPATPAAPFPALQKAHRGGVSGQKRPEMQQKTKGDLNAKNEQKTEAGAVLLPE